MSAATARRYLATLLPAGAFIDTPFDWSLGGGPAVAVRVGISESRMLELGLPAAAFLKGSDSWQLLTTGPSERPMDSNVVLADAMAPDEEAALIRLAGQIDVLRLLATGTW